MGIAVIGTGAAVALGVVYIFGVEPAMVVGLLAGGLTSTPGLSAATEGVTAAQEAAASAGYAISYIYGVLGVVLFVQLMPRIMRVDIAKERESFVAAGQVAIPEPKRKLFKLDPMKDGVVICHAEGFKRGIASNHGDIIHWWSKFGYTMDDFRRDVAEKMEDEDMTQEKFNEMMDNYLAHLATLPPSDWAAKNLKDAVSLGFTDGNSPRAFATREQVALMIRAAVYG